MVCTGCYNVFCPSCFNHAVTEGGRQDSTLTSCFACPVCGWSACA
jgi:hypothetical protein